MEEGLQELQFRAGIETARKNLHDNIMRKWATPYDIDPPRRIRLASAAAALSTRSIATTETSSTGFTSDSDPMVMERQIWNGIEALMADAFSEGGESVCTEDDLPKSLLRAMSHTSISTTSNVHSHLTPEEVDEIQLAQAALNSFMDMLLPEDMTKPEMVPMTVPCRPWKRCEIPNRNRMRELQWPKWHCTTLWMHYYMIWKTKPSLHPIIPVKYKSSISFNDPSKSMSTPKKRFDI